MAFAGVRHGGYLLQRNLLTFYLVAINILTMNTIEVDPVELKEAYESGGVQSVMELFGCSKPTAYKLLDSAGVERQYPNKGKRFVVQTEE